jgi:hypothetical protein
MEERMRSSLLVLAVVLVLTLLPRVSAAQPAPQLRLHRAILVPASQSPGLPTLALQQASTGPYAIIQFRGPITPGDRAALDQIGVFVLEYLPDFAYLVRGSRAQLAAAAGLPSVYARWPFTIGDKLAPALLRAVARGDAVVGKVRVLGWPDDQGALGHALRAFGRGAAVVTRTAELMQIAALPAVRWIEPVTYPRLLNDVARGIMHVSSAWQRRGIYGAGQVIAVADSGLDTGNPATISPDFAGRIVATHVLSAGGDLGDNFGHGTHVAGSVAGAGVQSGAQPTHHQYASSFAGVAPEAGLVIQAFEADASGNVLGLDPDYYTLFAQAYADGARLHTDSWGDPTGTQPGADEYGGYPYGAQRTDQFIWDHRDMAIFFAAGNQGRDGVPGAFGFCTGGDGVIDSDSLLYPGTAKNVITVGAAESQRTSGGYSALPWLLLDPSAFCFGTQPIATDLPSNNPDGMAAFSSRGPTDDGRVKPDIVAPGTNIVSDKSHYPGASSLWGDYDANYAYSGGTSMATPLTAGAGVLVRQWLAARGIANPSAAAIKATLLNTTHDMAPGQYGTGATQEIPSTRPNNVSGWGRVDLGFMDAPAPYTLWVDDHVAGLATGQLASYSHTAGRSLDVLSSDQPLQIMLAWSDSPASLSAARQLVNDLDLRVIGPGGTIYFGNNVPAGDRINNVEGVVIAHPPVGQYRVEVYGYNVPIATQPYALAVAGALSTRGQLTLTKSASPPLRIAPGGLITYTLMLNTNQPITQTVTLTDTLPLHSSFVSASDGGVLNGRVVQWAVPANAVGPAVMRTLVVRVDAQLPDSRPIVNFLYRATNGVDLPGVGPPVSLLVAAPGEQKTYIPLVAR